MNNNQIILECKRVKFFSPHDEAAFFEWIEKIKSISEVRGKKDSIFFIFENMIIKDEDLWEMVAIFRRYKINMKQLAIFVHEGNKDSFEYYQNGFSINVYPVNR